LLEAMGRGTPVVATAVGGIPEVVRDQIEGLLAPPDDVAALRTAIETALHDPRGSKERARRGQERAREYDWSVVGPQHRRIIVDV
jgi:glycosyltransferase involved in cell wall biosynthesis